MHRAAPAASVPVNMSLYVKRFYGLADSGQSFSVQLVSSLSWVDNRFPYDAGQYTETEADILLRDYWEPQVKISNLDLVLQRRTLKVIRHPGETKESLKDVVLSVKHEYRVTNSLDPEFQRFPFDVHELCLELSALNPESSIAYIPTTVVPQTTLDTWSDSGWLPAFTRNDMDLVTVKEPGVSFTLQLRVTRAWEVLLFRLLVPSCILVLISWAAFWISPKALMPRFASGFISFLSMQSFKTYAASLMPNNCKISTTTWIDIFISMGGILMGLSVIETVAVQYINETISSRACKNVDLAARFGISSDIPHHDCAHGYHY
jgi:hypothetical protein